MEWPQPVEAYVVAGPQVVGHPSRLCAHRSICVLECQKNAWQKRCKRSRTFSPHARDMENTQSWLVRLVAALRRTTRKAPWMATHNCCRAAVPTVHASVAQKSQCPPTSPDAAGMHNYRWDILETTAYIVSRRPAPRCAACAAQSSLPTQLQILLPPPGPPFALPPPPPPPPPHAFFNLSSASACVAASTCQGNARALDGGNTRQGGERQ